MVHARDFDPMVFEAEACRSWAPRLVADDGLLSHFVAQTIAPHVDPMLIESEAIFIPSNPSFVDDMPPSPPLVSQMEALPAVPALEGQAISPALESVCFPLQGPAPVLHSSPSLRNITVTRGTRESLLFNLFPDASTPVKETVANFVHAICGDAPPTGAGRFSTKAPFPAAATRIHHPAQRKAGKEVASPCHKAHGPGAERDDEEAGHHLGRPSPGRVLVPAIYGYILLHPHCLTM